MASIVEFPGLDITLTVPRVAFTVFGMPIYWYGVCIGVGMMLALVMAFSQAKRFGLDGDRMVDAIIGGFVLAIVGGRLYYIIFDDKQVYDTFFKLIDLRSGGIAIYGAIIGAFIGAALICKLRKIPMLPLFDLAGMGFLIGQACGRWGNFFNQEAFGDNTTLPWGMISPTTTAYLQYNQESLAAQGVIVDPFMPVHPTFLYESLWCILGFVLLFLYRKRRHFNGEIFLLYIMWYGAGRFFIEGLRTDSLTTFAFGLRVSQLVAALSAVVAFGVWLFARIKTKGKPLVVPALPPKTAKIKLQTESGPAVVRITWPGEEKTPSKEEQKRMAEELLEKEKNEPEQ